MWSKLERGRDPSEDHPFVDAGPTTHRPVHTVGAASRRPGVALRRRCGAASSDGGPVRSRGGPNRGRKLTGFGLDAKRSSACRALLAGPAARPRRLARRATRVHHHRSKALRGPRGFGAGLGEVLTYRRGRQRTRVLPSSAPQAPSWRHAERGGALLLAIAARRPRASRATRWI